MSRISTRGSSINACGLSWIVGMPQRLATSSALRFGARGDRDDREAGLLVARQMDIGHDEASADSPDLIVAAADRGVRVRIGVCQASLLPMRFVIAGLDCREALSGRRMKEGHPSPARHNRNRARRPRGEVCPGNRAFTVRDPHATTTTVEAPSGSTLTTAPSVPRRRRRPRRSCARAGSRPPAFSVCRRA